MNRLTCFSFIALGVALLAMPFGGCAASKKYPKDQYVVKMETSMGDIVVTLDNDTPLHRDNFVKLVNQHFYDGVSFHRVIKDFMIQTGDPNTKDPNSTKMPGTGDPGYTVPAEFVAGKLHRKGALAAARMGDQANPEKRSSGSQFYIVQGTVYTPEQMEQMEMRMTQNRAAQLAMQHFSEQRTTLVKEGMNQEDMRKIFDSLMMVELRHIDEFHFSPEARQVYTTVGGTPHLDNEYTVFGQVIEGIDVVDAIAAVETAAGDVPKNRVTINKMTILNTPKNLGK